MGWLWAIAAALGWASLDAVRKALANRVDAVAAVVGLSLGPAVLFGGWTLIEGAALPATAAYLAPALGSVALNALAYVCFMRALALSPLSLTIPLLSLSPVLTAVTALVLVGEWPAWPRALGLAVVVAGAVELQRPTDGTAWREGLLREPGTKYMLATAGLWSVASALDKRALLHAAVPVHALVQSLGVGLLLLGVLVVQRRARSLWALGRAWRPFVGALGLTTVAVGFQLMAYQALMVSLVEAIKRAVGVAVALLVGRLWFGEPVGRRQVAAVVALAAGAWLVLLG